jgi:hypothetical protein
MRIEEFETELTGGNALFRRPGIIAILGSAIDPRPIRSRCSVS